MRITRRRFVGTALGAGAGLMLAAAFGPAGAQPANYPAKTVRIIAPFPPGGSVDLISRALAPRLAESLGQSFVVDNRAGASGTIGTELAARSAPDGYTLLVNTIPLVTNTFLFNRVPYDALTDFAPIMLVTSSPSAVSVHPSVPPRNVRELLDLAKAKPGAIDYGTAGPGTNPHIAGELFNYLGKVNLVAVHFKGGGPALVAAISGEVSVSFSGVAETSRFVNAGRLRALGVTGQTRTPALPEVPTVAESGVPGYEFVTWSAILAPKNTPPAIVKLLNERLAAGLRHADVQQRLRDIGFEIVASSPEELGAHLKREAAKWGKVIRERGMKVE
ncbi:MAG: tripartite tricarboxylate transporter substrate binding protein [Burkholderiales bacterium]|nr:tripartite tricarboxylate transporter substrate binding protein [Burkholderiales bacterium]